MERVNLHMIVDGIVHCHLHRRLHHLLVVNRLRQDFNLERRSEPQCKRIIMRRTVPISCVLFGSIQDICYARLQGE